MKDINKKTLADDYGIKLDKGKYKIIKEGDFYEIYKVKDNTEGCVLAGKKNGDTLENIGMTDKMVELVRGNECYIKII